jgi:acyl dehydratase
MGVAALTTPKPTPAVDRVAAADDHCKTESLPAADAAGKGFPIASGWLTFGVGAGSVFDVG